MSEAIIKALSFVTFIIIGLLLKSKFNNAEEVNGLKKIILLVALPCTIFVALLKISLHVELLLLPLFALGFNLFLFVITPALLNLVGIKNKSIANTAKLLIPSLAPGLSCFPFILEFLGEPYLAKAAMTDLGNKFFVLFILYLVAIKWHYRNKNNKQESDLTRLKTLVKVMLFEPINLLIILALILLVSGISLADLPLFLQENLNRLSLIMTPLVLLFIGLAVKIKKKQLGQVFSLLMLRYGISLLLIAGVVAALKIQTSQDVLFMLAFGLSACSFWPFAHISSISAKEMDLPDHQKSFDNQFALGLLAMSLPLSVLLILIIFTTGDTFTNPLPIILLATGLITIGSLFTIFKWVKNQVILKSDLRKIN